jgi:hypothetical protein
LDKSPEARMDGDMGAAGTGGKPDICPLVDIWKKLKFKQVQIINTQNIKLSKKY